MPPSLLPVYPSFSDNTLLRGKPKHAAQYTTKILCICQATERRILKPTLKYQRSEQKRLLTFFLVSSKVFDSSLLASSSYVLACWILKLALSDLYTVVCSFNKTSSIHLHSEK